MIDPLQTASVADASRLSHTNTAVARSTAVRGASFAGELARFSRSATPSTASPSTATASTAPNAVKAETRPDNEQTKKVAGHPYSRVENGPDKGRYLNQVDGSPREGAVFKRVERDNRVLHVYGTGKDKVVVEVKSKAATAQPSPPATSGGTPSTT
jgi:hypothetical protein